MNEIRILRIITRMNVGGPARQVTTLMRGLDSGEFSQRLLIGELDAGEVDYLHLRAPDVYGRMVSGLGRSPRLMSDLGALARLVRHMREFEPHVVHTHTAKAGVLGRLAARVARVPATVHTFHGHLLHGYFGPVATSAVSATERLLARGTTRLIAVGERVRDELLDAGIGSPAQFDVVPPGIDMPTVPTLRAARAKLDVPPDVPVLAFVARLTGVKRPDRMLDVVELLRLRFPNLIVLVAGEGPLLPEVRRSAQMRGLEASIRFLGWRGDVETVYAASDVALLTSDNEGTPVSLIEAALCGVPAVASDVGSVAEVVLHGRTGLVVHGTPHSLAEAVDTLLSDRSMRAAMGRAAADHASVRYGAGRLIADCADLYRRIVYAPSDVGREELR